MSIGERVASGGIALTVGQTIVSLIAFTGSIIIARLLDPADYGILSRLYIFPGLLAPLTSLIMPIALTRYASYTHGDKHYISTGILFSFITGLFASSVLSSFADFFASLLSRPYIARYLRMFSAFALVAAVNGATCSILMGLEDFARVSIIYVIRQFTRISLAIGLIALGFGVQGAIIGVVTGVGLDSCIAMSLCIKRIGLRYMSGETLKEMLKYSLPLYIPLLISIPIAQLYRTLLAVILSDWSSLGELMDENYDIAREGGWAYEIDDKLRRIGLRNGAIAGKLGGAGNGGVMVFLCPEGRKRVIRALRKAGVKVFVPEMSSGVR